MGGVCEEVEVEHLDILEESSAAVGWTKEIAETK